MLPRHTTEKEGVNHVMREIYADLSETDSVILDLRFNEGGLNNPSMQFLRHFINRRYKAAVRTIYTNTILPVREEIFVEPAKENIFDQNVSLLTSHWSASASELFALSVMSGENFSRHGSETAGILSEIVYVVLPNGWEVSMSVDVVTDEAGTVYEVSGIPVDHLMNYAEDETTFYDSFFSGEQFSDPLIEKFIN